MHSHVYSLTKLTWLLKDPPPAGRTAAGAHLLVYQGLDVEGLEHIGAELGVEVHLPDALVKQLPHLPSPSHTPAQQAFE